MAVGVVVDAGGLADGLPFASLAVEGASEFGPVLFCCCGEGDGCVGDCTGFWTFAPAACKLESSRRRMALRLSIAPARDWSRGPRSFVWVYGAASEVGVLWAEHVVGTGARARAGAVVVKEEEKEEEEEEEEADGFGAVEVLGGECRIGGDEAETGRCERKRAMNRDREWVNG